MSMLFDLPERVSRVPLTIYKKISPDNPRAKVNLINALGLIYTGQLAETIRENNLAKLRANTAWIKALELLESEGLYQGLHFRDIAEHLGVHPESAKAACLKAETEIYEIYGIHIGFFDNNGVWRLGTDKDVARKYGTTMRAIVKWAKRASMYAEQARTFGAEAEPLMMPLYEIPEGLTDADAQA